MSGPTPIEWTDDTWPIVAGCAPASPGCDHCYAARNTAGRLRNLPAYAGLAEAGKFTGQVRLLPERLGWPLRQRKPKRIFVCSQSDLFHPAVPVEFIARVFAVMASAPQHTFQILTKRHARLRSLLGDECRCGGGHSPGTHFRSAMEWAATPHSPTYVPGLKSGLARRTGWPLPNVHIGVSVENQTWADRRIPYLQATPAKVRWVSAEPLLGPVDLTPYLGMTVLGFLDFLGHPVTPEPRLDWVVAGGESGPGARPMHPEWARLLRDQCAGAGVPFHFKQWGDWTDVAHGLAAAGDTPLLRQLTTTGQVTGDRVQDLDGTRMVRLGKRRAGRVLDGRTWDEYPHPGTERACRVCGCTETNACDPPCSWAGPDLCSACPPTGDNALTTSGPLAGAR